MENRDKLGRFARKSKGLLVLVGIIAIVYFLVWFLPKVVIVNKYARAETATTTEPTRLQMTEQFINQLTEARKKDKSFIDETNRQIAELMKQREDQARLDALMVVGTQMDVEASALLKK